MPLRRGSLWRGQADLHPAALFDGTTLRLWFAGNAQPQDFLSDVRSKGRTAKFGVGYATTDIHHYDGRP